MHPLTLLTGLAGLAWLGAKRSYRPLLPTYAGPSERLAGTSILSSLEAELPEHQNAVWCATSDWCRPQAGGALPGYLTISRPDPARFGLPSDGEITVCSLEAHLRFAVPFRSANQPLIFRASGGATRAVNWFGLRAEDRSKYRSIRRQVQILWEDDEGFALDICRFSRPFRVIVAQIPRPSSLGAGVEAVRQRCEQPPRPLDLCASLAIPAQSWELSQLFAIDASTFRAESIQFRLDRDGCQLASVSLICYLGRQEYHFDQPFLLYLETRPDEQPVMVMWVDNAELLAPW
ncbi:MAG: hypothetical protein AB7S38_25090 [Vulcanimicrobiota bacterium]